MHDGESCWVAIGVALEDEGPSALPGDTFGARRVQAQLVVPGGGRIVDARVGRPGQGAGRGLFAPVKKGDELVIVFAAGHAHSGVAIAGLGNGKAANPVDYDGTRDVLLNPDGVELRDVPAAPSFRIVHEQLLEDLKDYVTALETFMGTTSGAATAAVIAGAAVTFLTTVSAVSAPTPPSEFLTNLLAAIANGPPYAAAKHRVT